MYWAVKVVSLAVYPLGIAMIALVVAIALLGRGRRRAGLWAVTGAFAWLWFWSMPVTGDALIGWLERDFEYRPAEAIEPADAIVVAGGAFSSGLGQWPYPDAGGNVDRYWHAARLYHAGRAPLLILSGGRDPRRPESWSEAESGAIFLRDLGVPDEALVLESEARTTRDNAALVAEILQSRDLDHVLLVTSAAHMHRALATFRGAGIDARPVATDFSIVDDRPFDPRRYLPGAGGLSRSSAAVHEIVGLAYYRLRGWL